MSTKRRGRYFSPAAGAAPGRRAGGPTVYCSDRKLLPRIKEYLSERGGGSAVDIADLASALQAQYSEYGRKKKTAFYSVVAKVCRQLEGPSAEEQSLSRWEQQRLSKRKAEGVREEEDEGSPGSFTMPSSEDSDADFEANLLEDYNLMNDSLLKVYNSSPAHSSQPQVDKSTNAVVCSGDGGNGANFDSNILEDSQLAEKDDAAAQVTPDPRHFVPAPVKDPNQHRQHKTVPQQADLTAERKAALPRAAASDSTHAKHKRKRRAGEVESPGLSKRRKQGEKKQGSEMELDTKSASLVQKHSSEFSVSTSSTRFSDVGGCEACIKELCSVLLHFKHPELFSHLGVSPPRGFLLHGPPGSGKTLLAHAIAGEMALPFIRLAATEVVGGVSGESEATIRELFLLAKSVAPCVLFVDEVDAICRKRDTAQREMERRIVTQLLACLDDLSEAPPTSPVLVVGATSRPDALDPSLRRAGRFDREVALGIPDRAARERILEVLCRGLKLEAGFSFGGVARQTPGFVGADLKALIQEASLAAVNRVLIDVEPEVRVQGWLKDTPPLSIEQLQSIFVTARDFTEALGTVQPSAKREGFATVPDTTWADVGALQHVREELSMAILAPVRYPAQFAALGLSSPPGVLLAGPPGCGKTLLAKAIANETGINFISVKGPELLNMYVGESERAVRQVFQRARSSAPCIIFFDELDALCPRRSDLAESSASARVVNQLLTEMDGLEARKQVYLMAATNRPDIIDPAVLRPGRLDKLLYVGLPSHSDRTAILHTITRGGSKPRLAAEVDLEELTSDTFCFGFSGADLSGLVREAAVAALREHMKLYPCHMTAAGGSLLGAASPPAEDSSFGDCVVARRHFTEALSKMKPSVSAKERDFYQSLAERFT